MELAEAIERLRAMQEDHGEHWDLSEKDELAIGLVLDALVEKTLEAARCQS